jgi:hypothetical protein
MHPLSAAMFNDVTKLGHDMLHNLKTSPPTFIRVETALIFVAGFSPHPSLLPLLAHTQRSHNFGYVIPDAIHVIGSPVWS